VRGESEQTPLCPMLVEYLHIMIPEASNI